MKKLAGDDVTISKSSYNMMLVVVVAVLVVASFMGGFIIGGSGKTTTTGQIVQPDNTIPDDGIPSRVSVSLDDDAVKGSQDAKVTIIEFSDFQCPYCRSFYTETYKQIDNEYVKTGKVKIAYRDFPLSFHAAAQKSAEAAECAADQGKFWEMHDKIFEEQAKLGTGTVSYGVNELKKWASELGLDAESFNSCLDSGKYASEIQKDISDGTAAGVTGTPAFFVGSQDKGYILVAGAYPYEVFKQLIEQELAS